MVSVETLSNQISSICHIKAMHSLTNQSFVEKDVLTFPDMQLQSFSYLSGQHVSFCVHVHVHVHVYVAFHLFWLFLGSARVVSLFKILHERAH